MAMIDSLRVESLGMGYGDTPVLEAVSFSVRAGTHTAILGPSGSGKSTLLRLLAGLEAPTAGEVWLNGKLASRAGSTLIAPHARAVSMVFQDLALWPNLTALGNVELGLAALKLDRESRRERARDALRVCGLEGLEERRPAMLSMGQQQRVALARALAVRPTWLLLDEPFASLDLVLKERLFDELGTLSKEFACTLILVTHEPADARHLCSELVVLELGRVLEAGTWDQVLHEPRSQIVTIYRRLLRERPNA